MFEIVYEIIWALEAKHREEEHGGEKHESCRFRGVLFSRKNDRKEKMMNPPIQVGVDVFWFSSGRLSLVKI